MISETILDFSGEIPKAVGIDYLGLESTSNSRSRDFIAGMTDRYALNVYEKIFLPTFMADHLIRTRKGFRETFSASASHLVNNLLR